MSDPSCEYKENTQISLKVNPVFKGRITIYGWWQRRCEIQIRFWETKSWF